MRASPRARVRTRGGLDGLVSAAVRARGALDASTHLAGIGRARVRVRGDLGFSMRIAAGIARAAIRTRGAVDLPWHLGGLARAAMRVQADVRVRLDPRVVYTAPGDVLDEICWRRYGRADAVAMVLAANPGLAEAAPVLPAGIPIVLPDLPPAARATPACRSAVGRSASVDRATRAQRVQRAARRDLPSRHSSVEVRAGTASFTQRSGAGLASVESDTLALRRGHATP